MCTIAFATRVFPEAPLALGANREERFDRPARPPEQIDTDPAVFAPLDEEARGTWIGINEHRLLVAITNRSGGPDGERSRGWLVRDALECASVAEASRVTEAELDGTTYAGFNLLLASPTAAVVYSWDGTATSRDFEPGIHTIVNAGVDGETAKSATIRSRLQAPAIESVEAWSERVRPVLRDHGSGACLHGDGRGSRSSSLITLGSDGRITYRFADGPPCRTDYASVLDGTL